MAKAWDLSVSVSDYFIPAEFGFFFKKYSVYLFASVSKSPLNASQEPLATILKKISHE